MVQNLKFKVAGEGSGTNQTLTSMEMDLEY